MFKVIYQGKYGDTVESDNPKLDAYKHMAYLHMIGIRSGLIIRDGRYTVQAESITGMKLSDMTFEPPTSDTESKGA
jgi:hypothetical protein